MNAVGNTGWVAYRIALLLADRKGRIGVPRLAERAVRVALFLDLVLRGRITIDDDGVDIDASPTGFAAADTMLAYVEDNPDRTVVDVFSSVPVEVRDVVRDPGQARRGLRRSPTVDPAAVADVRDSLAQPDLGSPDVAVFVALADALQRIAVENLQAVYALCGPAADVIEDCHDHLGAVMDGLAGISSLMNSSASSG